MAINEIHHFEDTTVNIDLVKWASMWFFDTTLDQFGGYKADGTTLRYMFTTDNVRVPTTNLARLQLDDDAFVGLGAAKGRIEFTDETIDAINFLDANIGLGTSLPFFNVGTAAGDFSGTGLHVKGTGNTRIIVEGNTPSLTLADTGGAVDDKIGFYFVDAGLMKFISTNDDLTTRVNSILVMDMGAGNIGMGTDTALLNVGTAAGDFTGTGLHIKGAANTRVIVEGDVPSIFLADTAAAANEKIIGFEVNSERLKFLSLNDDLTTQSDNILTMDISNGNVGIGTTPASTIKAVISSTGDQLELEESGSDNAIFSVNSDGLLRIGASGGKVSITDTSLFPFTPAALLHLEAGTEQFRIGNAATLFVAQTVDSNNQLTFLFNTATKPAELVLEHATNNDANGVKFTLFKNDGGSLTSEDSQFNFDYDDSGGAQTTFAQILSTHAVITAGSEEGGLKFLAQNGAGALGVMFEFTKNKLAFFGGTPVVKAAAYTRNATIVEDRTLLASASASTINNNNVLAALIADFQAYTLLA